MGDYMGKKANGKLNRKIPYEEQSSKKPRRWDHIFGILTVATIIWFGLIIYNDFKSLPISITHKMKHWIMQWLQKMMI